MSDYHTERERRLEPRGNRRTRRPWGKNGGTHSNHSRPETTPHGSARFLDLDHAQTKLALLELKESLSRKDPWGRDVEFQRQNVRHQYMSMISEQTAQHRTKNRESKASVDQHHVISILNLLWLDTSHALISVYRQKLNFYDRLIESSDKQVKLSTRRKNTANPQHPSSQIGPVARRKVLQHFRSFLKSEETFWKSLIHRLIIDYQLKAAESCLKVLKISSGNPIFDGFNDTPKPVQVEEQALPESSQTCKRPSEPTAQQTRETSQANNFQGMLLVQKALICFGDLTRYQELYSHPSQDKINDQASPATPHARSRSHQYHKPAAEKERDWSKAYDCYNQARLLLPSNGNPSNQLAVLCSYAPDRLSSAYHYYRALCVKHPFPTARQNLKMMYSKALAKWTIECDNDQTPTCAQGKYDKFDPNDPSQQRVLHQLEFDFVALHAMIYIDKLDQFHRTNQTICFEVTRYLKDRALPQELIMKLIVTSMAAAWFPRAVREMEQALQPSSSKDLMTLEIPNTEAHAFIHLLKLIGVLLEVVDVELRSIDDSAVLAVVEDLSQNISAVLRRLLPPLRITSKWILSGHFNRILRVHKRTSTQDSSNYSSNPSVNDELGKAINQFWIRYDRVIALVKQRFPSRALPVLDSSFILEEDADLAGFLPLRKGIARSSSAQESALLQNSPIDALVSSKAHEAIHPNEEHLMRLWDIQRDSKLVLHKYENLLKQILQSEVTSSSGIQGNLHDSSDKVTSQPVDASSQRQLGDIVELESEDEGDYWMDDDDPVELAMRAVVAQQMNNLDRTEDFELSGLPSDRQEEADGRDEEEDDEVLYLPSTVDADRHEIKDGAGDRRIEDQKDEGLTAADLLASIIKPKPTNIETSQLNTTTSPTGWSSLSNMTQSTNNNNDKVKDFDGMLLGQKRTPSISLPKPIFESSSSFNIWANHPRLSSFSCDDLQREQNDWNDNMKHMFSHGEKS